jgi:DNA ligase-1
MTTLTLSELFAAIEKTPKRLEMQALLSAFYTTASETDAAIVSYLLMGRLVPEFIAVEFQLAEKTLTAAIESIVGTSITKEMSDIGDLGSVWEKFAPVNNNELELVSFYNSLWEIAATKKEGSQKKKQLLIVALLQKLSPVAGKYAIRILSSKLRLGASDRTILESLGKLPGGEIERLKQLFADTSDIGHTVYLFQKYGENCYEHGSFLPGVPVSAKLVAPEKTLEAIFKRIPEPYLEPKYDGLRIQVHVFKHEKIQALYADRVWNTQYNSFVAAEVEPTEPELTLFAATKAPEASEFDVMLFSRNLENMTEMFPEVVAAAKLLPKQYEQCHGVTVENIVIDGEVIGFNDALEEYLPFSDTMTRKRKYKVAEVSEQTPTKVFSFDMILLNGQNLTTLPLVERKAMLSFLDTPLEGQSIIRKTPFKQVKAVDEAAELFEQYMEVGLEGVIFKNPHSTYDAGVRNYEWIKFKRDMVEEHKLTDSIDVVVIGYSYGKGRLAAMGVGKVLTALYDAKNDRYLSFTKVGTKMTDEQRLEMRRRCDEFKVDKKPENVEVSKMLLPDVWLYPELVIEITGYEITKSLNPAHVSGYSLRFPKFLKFREKRADQITTVEEIANIAK